MSCSPDIPEVWHRTALAPCIPTRVSGCNHSLGHHNLRVCSQQETWVQCLAWSEHHQCQGKAEALLSSRAQPLCTDSTVREKKRREINTWHPSTQTWVLLGEDSGSESCFLIGHDLHPIQTKNYKNFLQLHHLYHTFKYCTNAKAELTSLKKGALINIKDNFRTSKNFHKTLRTKSSENLINVAYVMGCANIKLNCLKNYMQIKYNTAINKAYL